MGERMSRKSFLKLGIIGGAGALAACTPIGKTALELTKTATSTKKSEPSQTTSTLEKKSTSTATEVPSTSTPTASETSIPTPEQLIDRYAVVDGRLMQKVGGGWSEIALPQGVERVDYTEMHNGDLYTIQKRGDRLEVANAKFDIQKNEWKKYDWPKGIVGGGAVDYMPQDLNQQLEKGPDYIERLQGNNLEDIPFGIVSSSQEDPKHYMLSGVIRGTYILPANNRGFRCVIAEIPGKFARQQILFNFLEVNNFYGEVGYLPQPVPSNIPKEISGLWSGYQFENLKKIQELYRVLPQERINSGKDFSNFIQNNRVSWEGKQILFLTRRGGPREENTDYSRNPISPEELDQNDELILQAISKGDSVNNLNPGLSQYLSLIILPQHN